MKASLGYLGELEASPSYMSQETLLSGESYNSHEEGDTGRANCTQTRSVCPESFSETHSLRQQGRAEGIWHLSTHPTDKATENPATLDHLLCE